MTQQQQTTDREPQQDQTPKHPRDQKEEQCCDGKQTAQEHRAHSSDGKCCVDD